MKIKFKPLPGLTIVTLICLGILLTLGTWQYKRLIWKTNLLAEIDEAANAQPLTSIANINELLAQEKPVDFRRITLSGDFITTSFNQGRAFHLMRSTGKAYTWRLYQVFQAGGQRAYVAATEFSDQQKHNPPKELTGPEQIFGYVRLVRPANKFIPKSNLETNRWFAFNGAPDQLDWSDGGTIETAYYIDWAMEATGADQLAVRKPEIRNPHLDYMLTWYSFAVILLIIYFLLHKKQGRLSFKSE